MAKNPIEAAYVTITTVFLDLYQTLAYFHPERELRQWDVLREYGFQVELEAVRRAYIEADHDYTLVGMKTPLYDMTREERHLIYVRFQEVLLRSLGLNHAVHMAEEIYQRFWKLDRELQLYPDVAPALTELKQRGYKIGLITNVTDDPTEDVERIGLGKWIDEVIASCLVRCDKPNPKIFEIALERLDAVPEEAVHVGDQLLSDAEGATSAGIKGVLLDRYGLQDGGHHLRIQSLFELPSLLENEIAR
jgi:HAD superfamily hydrolase (TIGR01549 family)